jgi:hypothetical protein
MGEWETIGTWRFHHETIGVYYVLVFYHQKLKLEKPTQGNLTRTNWNMEV